MLKRQVGNDRNNKPLYLGDKVKVYQDYTGNPCIYEGTLITSNEGWIYVKIEIPEYVRGKVFPFTNHMTLDMGQSGIWGFKIEFEKVEDESNETPKGDN